MVITAYLEWHNCNNGWKAGGLPILSILATGHPVSSTVYICVKIPLKGVSSVAAHSVCTIVHSSSGAQHIQLMLTFILQK